MANRRRGEVAATVAGERRTLCLTLGSLAELEDAFGVDDLAALAARFGSGRLSARDLIRLYGAGLRGAGAPVTDAEVAGLAVGDALPEVAAAVAALLEATFGGAGEGGREGEPDPLPAGPG